MFRTLAVALALFLAVPALPALAAWPAEVTAANDALANASSFRMTTTEGTAVNTIDVHGATGRAETVLPGNVIVLRQPDGSDGVSAAHLYRIVYPGATPQLLWFIRQSDGLVHRIRRPGRAGTMTVTIDSYRGLPARRGH
jgi:hypothetical protein